LVREFRARWVQWRRGVGVYGICSRGNSDDERRCDGNDETI